MVDLLLEDADDAHHSLLELQEVLPANRVTIRKLKLQLPTWCQIKLKLKEVI